MDQIGWFIATLHQMIGHDKTAAVIGAAPGDRWACLLCQFEADPAAARKQAVIDAIGTAVRETGR